MRRNRKTKILATLGPASESPEMIKALFEAGADIFRINMSHASHPEMRKRLGIIRDLDKVEGRPVGVLADLQGPKIRLGTLLDGVLETKNGDKLHMVCAKEAPLSKGIPLPHPEIFAAVKPGNSLLVDDGKVRLKVLSVADSKEEMDVEVVVAGPLKNKKGVNVPDAVLPISAMTPKDHADLEAVLEAGVDWIALSFVQRPEDVAEIKKIVKGRAKVLSKIEKPQALEYIAEIVDLSDGIMVARGDMGVEMPVQEVPIRQKQIVALARKAGKPVVVATQMLESMIESPVPTRAEVSDVANAMYDGADAVMLSAESASGSFPIEAVSMMDKVAVQVEHDPIYVERVETNRIPPEPTTADAIMAAVHEITRTIHAAAIVCWTKSGATALRAARERPEAPIIALTPSQETAHQLAPVWGLHSVYTEDAKDLDDMVDRACDYALSEGFAKPGQRIVVTAGVPLRTPGATNMLRVAFVGKK